MRKLLAIGCMALSLAMGACNFGSVFSDRKSLGADMVWNMDNVLVFEPSISDTISAYDLVVDLRTVDFYPYSNMWLYITTISPSGRQCKDTMECILRDSKGFSNATGRMNFGELEDYEFPFKQNVRFQEPGQYKFMVQHGMRDSLLPFVNEVGLSILKRDK
ncbi:MAG: gliding motility lipoprotein GldH [Bacteroidales bacterium]|nr:gliding motility lipoprotein GldH [Bacteroidales bacterium]